VLIRESRVHPPPRHIDILCLPHFFLVYSTTEVQMTKKFTRRRSRQGHPASYRHRRPRTIQLRPHIQPLVTTQALPPVQPPEGHYNNPTPSQFDNSSEIVPSTPCINRENGPGGDSSDDDDANDDDDIDGAGNDPGSDSSDDEAANDEDDLDGGNNNIHDGAGFAEPPPAGIVPAIEPVAHLPVPAPGPEGGDGEGGDGDDDPVSDGIFNINPMTLWALLQTSGTRKLSVDQYDSVRSMISTLLPNAANDVHLPHYRTLMRTLRPTVLRELAVREQVFELDTRLSASGARANLIPGQGLKSRISFVPPIQYAKADMRSTIFFNNFRNLAESAAQHANLPRTNIADTSPFIAGREWFTEEMKMIDIGGDFDPQNNNDIVPSFGFAEKHDTVKMRTMGIGQIDRNDQLILRFAPDDNQHYQGVITCIFMVHHAASWPRLGFGMHAGDETDERSANIRSCLSYFDWEWDHQSMAHTIPDEARLLVQPSDIIAILRPVAADSGDRMIVVHRFIITPGEPRRFVFILPADANLTPLQPTDCAPEVVSGLAYDLYPPYLKVHALDNVKMLQRHPHQRGWKNFPTPPILGTLAGEANESYAIYRCSLYIDGFRTGSSGISYTGIYLQPLSVPSRCRNDAGSSRVICAVPPGVSLGEVMRHIIDDYIAQVQVGAIVVDARGQRRRVFVDIINLVGDTPGMNEFIDVLGSSGRSPCHRCNYRALPRNVLPSRFVGQPGSWCEAASRRSAERHIAIRESQVPAEAYTFLGMVAEPSPACLSLYTWRERLRAVGHLIPRTTDNLPVVSPSFDPHASVAIGGDHVIGNHLQNVFNAAARSLPALTARRQFISAIRGFVKEKALPTDNMMFPGESVSGDTQFGGKTLITHKYILLPFVAQSYDTALNSIAEDAETEYRDKISDLLHTLTTFVGQNWARPHIPPYLSSSHSESAQRAFSRYWDALREVIEVPDAMAVLFTNNQGEVEVVAGAGNDYRLIYDTIRELDKPNLHRFFEYIIEQIHFWSHPFWLGELTLERTHQRLKTVIRKSNKKQEHLLMMNAMRFNDWQGRLTSLFNIGAPNQQLPFNIPFNECASLISGVRNNGLPVAIPNAASIATLAQLLHPGGVVARELRMQQQFVYGFHGVYCNDANADTFQLSTNLRGIPSIAFGNIQEQAPPILETLGQPFDIDNQQRYALRILRSCRCPRRRIVITSGDIVEEHAPENSPPSFVQILFFIRDANANDIFRYAARRGTVSNPDINLRRYFTPTIPFIYTFELINGESKFISAMHACAEEDCRTSDLGNVIHRLQANGANRFLLLDSSSAFPPRKG